MAFAKLNSMKFVGLDGLNHFWTKAKTWIINRITTEVTAKIAEVVAKAPEDLDTLREIADWIKSHANDAAAMNTAISTNTEAISGKADKNHTHIKSEITDFPTSLKNPNALTINGKTYDGSTAVDAGVQTVANGGTGVTTQAEINKAFIGNLDTGNSDVTDGTEFVSSWASDNGFNETTEGAVNTPYKRKFSKVWNYIKDKISSVLGLTANNYGGTAATILDYIRNTPIKVRWGGPGIDSAEWYPAFNADGSAIEPINRTKIHAGTAIKASLLDEYVGAGGTRLTSGNIIPKDATEYGGMRKDVVTSSMTDSGRPGSDGHLLTMFWDNSGRYDNQLFVSNEKQPLTVKVRAKGNEADYGPWVDLITSQNIGSQTVAKAINATNDSNGKNISNTYMPKSGGTFNGNVTFYGILQGTDPNSSINFTPGDVEINAAIDIMLNTPSGNVYVNNGLIIDTDEIYIQSPYGYKRLDSYIKNVVADSSVSK